MRILLVGAVVFLAAWFTLLRPKAAEVPPATTTTPTTTTATAPATTTRGDDATKTDVGDHDRARPQARRRARDPGRGAREAAQGRRRRADGARRRSCSA